MLASEQSHSTRLVRHLLIKGADQKIRDKKNRTVLEYADQKIGNPSWKDTVCKILRDSDSSNKKCSDRLFEFLQIQQAMNKQTKSATTMTMFATLMVTCWLVMHFITFPYLTGESA